MAESGKRNYRQDLTDQIIALVEKGNAPWQKPWDATKSTIQIPHNAATGRPYRGCNALYLMVKAQQLGSTDPRWCTYKQAQDNGWQVKRGAKGTTVEYWKYPETVKEIVNPDTGEKEKVLDVNALNQRPSVFYATVFHASQIEGIPELPKREITWNPVELAENILHNSGAKIYHDQADNAYYLPRKDEIHLPTKEAFSSEMDYYEVAMHELGHWTGHESRLNRDLSGRFGTESYAKEELRAQMASLFLAAETGIPFNPERHASYQASWVKVLKNDKNEIFKAAKDAEGIADYLIDLSKQERTLERSLDQTLEKPLEKMMHYTFVKENHNAIEKDIMKIKELDIDFAAKMIKEGAEINDVKRALEISSPLTSHDTKTRKAYVENIIKESQNKETVGQNLERTEKINAILNYKAISSAASAHKDYMKEAQTIVKTNGNFPGQETDIKIAQKLILKGHSEASIKNAIKKSSPELAGKTTFEATAYLKTTFEKAKTMQLQKQLKSKNMELSR